MMPLENLLQKYDKLLFVDTETTGFSPERDRIIELTAITIRPGKTGWYRYRTYDSFIQLPRYSHIPSKITELTGITDSDLLLHGAPEQYVANEFCHMISTEKTLLIAHNARFDVKFINAMLERQCSSYHLWHLDYLDTLKVYKDRVPKNHKLSDAIAHYGLDQIVSNSHRAIDDVEALIEVAKAMNKEKSDLDTYIQSFDELLATKAK